MGFKYQKSLEELQEALVRQVCQLRRSMAGYDEGHIDEAERLTSTLYTLFLD